jgi:hypothetical protein
METGDAARRPLAKSANGLHGGRGTTLVRSWWTSGVY